MVDEEREYIGIMKSLGYANHQILTKFITYAVLATSIGATLGLIVGYMFIPKIIFFAYSSMYNFLRPLFQGYPLYTSIALGPPLFRLWSELVCCSSFTKV